MRAVALCLLLTGCATERLVEVRVPMQVACQVAEPERPALPLDSLPIDAPVDVQARHLRAEVDVLTGWADRLVTALQGCRSLP